MIPTKGDPSPTQITGTVKAIKADKDPGRFEVVVDTGKGDRSFNLYVSPPQAPFAVGAKIDANLRRGGGWHQVYDALIKIDGKIVLITSGSGAYDWADGWTVTTGKVITSEQNPNFKGKSENRTHALDFARGKTKSTVLPNKCVVIKDGADTYIVSGFGNSWIGARPPEGVDYQTFSMMRWN